MARSGKSEGILCDVFVGEQESFLDCAGVVREVLRPAGLISLQFSNSRRASFCRMFIETRDSLLLIVWWPRVRASPGSLVVNGWTGPRAEGDVEVRYEPRVRAFSRGPLLISSQSPSMSTR